MDSLPCGCKFGAYGDNFVFEPCSSTCSNYAYVHTQARKSGKPIAEAKPEDLTGQLEFAAICPFCGQKADGYTAYNLNKPSPGDFAICFYCGGIGVYAESSIRKPTPEEVVEIKDDEQAMAMSASIKEKRRYRRGN